MTVRRRPVMIELDADDSYLLAEIAQHLGVPRVQVLRWALRHYAVCGPWSIGAPGRREELLEGIDSLEVGPHRMEVER